MIHVVAIDGPAGSGKSTVASGVASALGLEVLDTGAMYRAVTLLAIERGLDLGDGEAIARAAEEAALELGDPPGSVRLDGRDVSAEIRGPAVSAGVSEVSAHPAVRALLRARQREWVEQRGGGVVEGRDIGTVVFTDAPVKVFLTANPEERARRRAEELGTDVETVLRDQALRDAQDEEREHSPLVRAGDAVELDTSGLTIDEVVGRIVDLARTAEKR